MSLTKYLQRDVVDLSPVHCQQEDPEIKKQECQGFEVVHAIIEEASSVACLSGTLPRFARES